MKLCEAAELFYTSMATVKSDATIEWYRKKIDPLNDFFDKDVEEINLFDLEKFRETLNRPSKAPGRDGKVSVYTIHGHVRAWRRFFGFLRKRKIITGNPAEDLEKPRLPKQPRKGIPPENASKMVKAARVNPRDYAILLFARDTACRAGGIYNLLTSNLDLKHNKAVIREKGDKERVVFFTSETTLALVLYASIRENPNQDDHFFLGKTHEPLTYTGVYQIFRRVADKTHIKTKYSPHQWRHAAARSWIQAGMNLKIVSEILGHGSEQVTGDIYGTLNELELQTAYNNISIKIGTEIEN